MSVEMSIVEADSRVVRQEFIAPKTIAFRNLITEEDSLRDVQLSPDFKSSAVSLSRLSDAKIWVNSEVICVYDDEHGIYEELSLYDDSFDFSRVAKTPLQQVDGTFVLLPHLDPNNYYHWLLDTMPCFGVLQRAGLILEDIQHYYIHRYTTRYQRRHLKQLGINPDKVKAWNHKIKHFSVKDLVVPYFRLDQGGWPNPWAVEYLKKQWLPEHISNNPAANDDHKTGRRIYVARGDARRKVTNEAKLIERLSKAGYIIVEPHKLTIEEQAAYFAEADYILGSHGAGLVNAVFCKPGVKLLEFGGHYITVHFRIVAELNQLQYRSIAGGLNNEGQRVTRFEGNSRDIDFDADVEYILAQAESYFST